MGHAAKILADSISPDGVRLLSFECEYPRIIHAEMMTHRVFSRNAASSRAIPIKKMIEMVMEDPYVPSIWGQNQKGMQAETEVNAVVAYDARYQWLSARDAAVRYAERLLQLGIHKQLTNRLLEPFLWYKCIISGTEWGNFFHLRNNKDAHPDIQIIARMMQELYEKREPQRLEYGQWHTPLISDEEQYTFCDSDPAALPVADKLKVSVARCARVSYLTHLGTRDLQADLDLHDRLLASGHLSPFEHVARPMTRHETTPSEARPDECFSGNFRGWVQHRKEIPSESDILGVR